MFIRTIFITDYSALGRGHRQGCPLSPPLFSAAVEPLRAILRSSHLFKRIVQYGVECKLSLYADDLLWYVTDPVASMPAVLGVLETFSSVSGYELNLEKSDCFPVSTERVRSTFSI